MTYRRASSFLTACVACFHILRSRIRGLQLISDFSQRFIQSVKGTMHHTANGVSIRLDQPKKQPKGKRPTSAELRRAKLNPNMSHGPVGRNEFQDAIVVMKSVYNEINEGEVPPGLSAMDTLVGYRTAPALKLLHQRTWRDFFDELKDKGGPYKVVEEAEKRDNDANVAQSRASSSHGGGQRHTRHQRRQQHLQPQLHGSMDMEAGLNDAFMRMHRRVEMLWEEVKVSQHDQHFYRSSLLRGPPKGVEHCKEIARYIRALLMHRVAIIEVLQAIAERERALEACFDSFAAVHRRMMRESTQREDPSSHTSQLHERAKPGLMGFWREEISNALADLQRTSLTVVRCIQTWRRGMWRPKPFLWRNQNYLIKMKEDMGVLEADTYVSLLSRLNISPDALLCVSFTDPALYRPRERKMPVQTPSSSKDLVNSLDANMNALALGSFPTEDGRTQDLTASLDEVRDQLLQAGTVVMEEEDMQRALATETRTLQAKRVFIPTLKVPTSLDEQSRRGASSTSTEAAKGIGATGGTLDNRSGADSDTRLTREGGSGDPFADLLSDAKDEPGSNRKLGNDPFKLSLEVEARSPPRNSGTTTEYPDDFE